MIKKIKAIIYSFLSKLVSPVFYLLPRRHITYSNDLLFTYHNADFIKEKKFAEAYALVKKVDNGRLLANYDIQWRIHVLCWAASYAIKLEGNFADCGVFSGFCPRAVIHYTNFNQTSKKYFLFDTFFGLDPQYSTADELVRNKKLGYKEKDMYEEVKETFKDFNVEIIKGSVPDTLTHVQNEKFCFIHLDMNAVYPELKALEFFWDRMVDGGIIVLDDYGFAGCLDQKKGHDEFARSKNAMILSLPTGQGVIIKK